MYMVAWMHYKENRKIPGISVKTEVVRGARAESQLWIVGLEPIAFKIAGLDSSQSVADNEESLAWQAKTPVRERAPSPSLTLLLSLLIVIGLG